MRLLAATLLTALAASCPGLLPAGESPARADSDPAPAPARHGQWPLSPRPELARGFTAPASRWGPGHRGVDLVGRVGAEVRAALPGRVTFAAPIAGRGVVVVDHGGVRTTYEPVHARVAVGATIGRGAVLGTLQHGGSHCYPRACLHWGLLRGQDYLNPLTLVGAGPLRLLAWRDESAPVPLPGPSGPTRAVAVPPPGPRAAPSTAGGRSRSGWPGSARWQ